MVALLLFVPRVSMPKLASLVLSVTAAGYHIYPVRALLPALDIALSRPFGAAVVVVVGVVCGLVAYSAQHGLVARLTALRQARAPHGSLVVPPAE